VTQLLRIFLKTSKGKLAFATPPSTVFDADKNFETERNLMDTTAKALNALTALKQPGLEFALGIGLHSKFCL